MENPVFKLEKVVHTKTEEMQDFEGPLDLILFLLSRNKMEIQDISISLICDQYLAWLALRRSMDLEIASDFVAMASQLTLIKSRMLLSVEDEEAKTEMDALIQSLEERRRSEGYAAIQNMAKGLAALEEFGRSIVTRNPEPVQRGKVYEYHQQSADLTAALGELRERSSEAAFREIAQHEPYPVESKAREILQTIRERGILRLIQLFFGCRSRSEIVAAFLAVLELCRSHLLRLTGVERDYMVREGNGTEEVDYGPPITEGPDTYAEKPDTYAPDAYPPDIYEEAAAKAAYPLYGMEAEQLTAGA